jgi:hypothetical protein
MLGNLILQERKQISIEIPFRWELFSLIHSSTDTVDANTTIEARCFSFLSLVFSPEVVMNSPKGNFPLN